MSEDYGRRLLPSILQHEARINPQRTFALIARSDDVDDGFDRVTYGQVADAANYATKWLQDRFEHGQQPSGHPTIAYIGPSDLRYNIMFYGALQCRYKLFLPSPRNLIPINVSLLEQTECVRLVHAVELGSIAADLKQACGNDKVKCEQLPSLRELLNTPKFDYQYNLQYADVYQEPILVLHSSGSTGRPKPVICTHGSFATLDVRDFPTVPGRRNLEFPTTFQLSKPESCMYDVFPPFHLAGFTAKVIVPLITGTVPVFGPPSRPPTGTLVAKTIRFCKPCIIYFPPVIIEQLFHEPDHESLFKQADMVLYAGGPLSHETGSQLSKWVPLCQLYGSTEVGQFRQLQPLRNDWAYLEFHPHEKFELQRLEAGSDLYELVMYTGEHLKKTSAIYHNYPELTEWRTKDLFEPHPEKPNLWKFHARVDDILVFSSGQKLNPIPFESQMSTVSGIKGVLIVGTRQARPVLLLELAEENSFADPKVDLWPSIEAANSLLPGYGRITRPMVIIAKPDKSFKRAPKGSIIRRQTEELYEDEIQRLYKEPLEQKVPTSMFLKPSAFTAKDVEMLLQSLLKYVAIDGSIGGDENLFNHGLDSVRTTEFISILRTNLLAYKPEEKLQWLSLETIYLNPTISSLSQILLDFLNNDKVPTKLDSVAEMKAKIEVYTSNFPHTSPVMSQSKGHGQTNFGIAITGTTGFFGQHLLSQLIACPEVSSIYCLNRSPSAQAKFEELGVKHDKNLVFLRIDISSPRLGLNDNDYTLLLENCSLVLHNAWQVDFNLPLEAFNVHLDGIRNIINLCADSVLQPRLVFISSIASTGVFAPAESQRRLVPEKMANIDDVANGMDIGYAKAKSVAEHILDRAAATFGISTYILRLGHVLPASDGRGAWPNNDVLALFLETSKRYGKVATDYFDTVNWLPVDSGAKIVSEVVQNILVRSDSMAGTQVYNIVNPQTRSWSSITEMMASWFGKEASMVPITEWVDGLHKTDTSDTAVLSRLPALRLMRFYDIWAKRGPTHEYSTEQSLTISKTMRALTAPDDVLIDQWLDRLWDQRRT